MSGGYFVLGHCYSCKRPITFNPHLVPSIPVDPANMLPADMGEHESDVEFVRQPVCEQCVEVANLIRKANGREQIDIWPGAYEYVEGLP